uniref:CdiI_2 domain-containing protein n=1 Tax=Steinernema glaseri TaxID=37863 RepID=A0A1I8AS79_9BILA
MQIEGLDQEFVTEVFEYFSSMIEGLDQEFVAEVFEYFSSMLKKEYDIDEERESIFDVIRFFYRSGCES